MPKPSSPILASVLLVLLFFCATSVNAFVSPRLQQSTSSNFDSCIAAAAAAAENDPNEIVARRIIVEGDVQGGYYRSCVRNEAGRFRRLSGTMTPPDDSSTTAEIYVEGKRKMMDGFVRWCKKSDVGLSQQISVSEVKEEEPTGLYDDFYVKIQ